LKNSPEDPKSSQHQRQSSATEGPSQNTVEILSIP